MESLKVGTRMICNGYEGAVKEICTGQLSGMAVVRLNSGSTCVSITELRPYSPCDSIGRAIDENWYGAPGWNRDGSPVTP